MPEGSQDQGNQGQGAGDAAQSAGNAGQGAGGGKTFTQQELDAIIADRLSRERGKYADYDDLRKAAGRLAEMEKSQLSEKERLERELSETKARESALASQVRLHQAQSAAAKAGALYPDLVAAKIPPEAIGNEKQLDAAIADLKKQYPALFGRGGGSADGGAGGNTPAGGGMNQFIRLAAGR